MAAADSELVAQKHTEDMVTYEELQFLEYDFDDVESDISRQQYRLSAPLYTRRAALTCKLDHFWALVLEQAPPDLDQFITPSDSKLIAECLKDVQVTRPEIDDLAGSPRSVHIKFTFTPNEYFEDEVLEKTFWWRRAADNWTGLVSEPVKIHWKKGSDFTKGLTDAAYNLWQKKQKQSNGATNGDAKKLPEEAALARKLENAGEETTSFFTMFAFVSERRYVSADESAKANAAQKERRERKRNGEEVIEPPPEEVDSAEQEVEVCPHGADIAMVMAEDIWPNAIKYFSEYIPSRNGH